MGEIKLNLTPGDYIVVPLRGSKDFPYLLGEQRRKISITKGQTTTMDIDYSNGTKCLAENTLIYTANGPVAVQNLHEGTKIWTINKNGEKELQPILKTSSATVPNNYAIVRLVLSDGRELYVSPGHPTYNGKTISELKINDKYDKARVIYYDTVQYHSDRTYDLLPAGDTGFYWANGILMGSTLKE
ncbi:hypothetical protein HY345_03040 [Candidatus Microgenomates bacterium]|nr:hypothetical protein [Candidatus Microgenomates bacterium]